jgi:hypothetical protein
MIVCHWHWHAAGAICADGRGGAKMAAGSSIRNLKSQSAAKTDTGTATDSLADSDRRARRPAAAATDSRHGGVDSDSYTDAGTDGDRDRDSGAGLRVRVGPPRAGPSETEGLGVGA